MWWLSDSSKFSGRLGISCLLLYTVYATSYRSTLHSWTVSFVNLMLKINICWQKNVSSGNVKLSLKIKRWIKIFEWSFRDLCHEILGHMAMFLNPTYAQFIQEIGIASLGCSEKDCDALIRVRLIHYIFNFNIFMIF